MVAFGGTSGVSSEIAKHLRAIYEEHNETLTAPLVVKVAADETSPLHSHFEWNDEIAGHRHRLAQAGQLIRSCKVVFKDAAGVERRVNEYQTTVVRDPSKSKGDKRQVRVYKATESIAMDAAASDAMLRQFRLEWTAFQRRWENFEEFVKLFGRPKA